MPVQNPAPWEAAWKKWMTGDKGRGKQLKKDLARPADMSPKDGLRLMPYQGCMACGKENTRKVSLYIYYVLAEGVTCLCECWLTSSSGDLPTWDERWLLL